MIRNNFIIFFIAFRYLKSKKYRFLPSIGVFMSSIAVILSIAMLIIVTSVMNGFREELLSKIIGFSAHINAFSYKDGIENVNEKISTIKKNKHVKSVISIVSGQVMIFKDNEFSGIMLKGMDYSDLIQRSEIKNAIFGDFEKFQKDEFSIFLGSEIALKLGVYSGDIVNMIMPVITPTIFGIMPKYKQVEIAGIIRTGSQIYDSTVAIISSTGAKKLLQKNFSTNIEIMLDDLKNTHLVQNALEEKISDIHFSNWENENASLMSALKIEASVMSLILGLFVSISIFTIFAIVNMMINEKEREIAILRSIGMKKTEINKIYFLVGLSISMIGIIFGNCIGILATINLENIRLFIEKILHISLLNPSIYLLSNLPTKIILEDIIKINLISFIFAIFALIIPARKAGKKDISEILKHF